MSADCDRGFRAASEGVKVEIDGVRDRCNYYGGYDQLPTTLVGIVSSLDGGLSWLKVDSSSQGKLGTIIFGFEGGKSSV